MDPDAALINLRHSIESAKLLMLHGIPSKPTAHEVPMSIAKLEDQLWALIEHAEALDSWLSRGGFLPTDWKR